MINAKNVTIYGFQSEEEKAEGEFALPIELHNCKDILLQQHIVLELFLCRNHFLIV